MQNKIYFGTDGIRGKSGTFPIIPEIIFKIGISISQTLKKKYKSKIKILIGKDTRYSCNMIEKFLIKGLILNKIKIYNLKIIPTPIISYLIQKFNFKIGIMISASHNSNIYNGIKIIINNKKKITYNFEQIIEKKTNKLINKKIFFIPKFKYKKKKTNYLINNYIKFCTNYIYKNNLFLNKFKILIDCANGSICNILTKIFKKTNIKLLLINNKPNGNNINKNSGTNYINKTKKQILNYKINLGIICDGDGDRIILIDHLGKIINGDKILYIISSYLKKKKQFKNQGVIGTILSNSNLKKSLKKINIPFIRTKVGYKNIIKKLYENNWNIGGEPCGHIILLNKNIISDPILIGLKILNIIKEKKTTLNELSKKIKLIPQKKISININNKNYKNILILKKKIINFFKKKKEKNDKIIIHKSGTEPLLKIMIECLDKKKINFFFKQINKIYKNNF